jgi:uncharacterized protein YbaP (TraB family)
MDNHAGSVSLCHSIAMKQITSSALAVFFILPNAMPLAADEPAHPSKPMLWKVEGGKLEKPSYLFGTIHMGHGPLANLHPAVETAIDGSDAVYTEMALDVEGQTKQVMEMMRKDGKTLNEAIGKELSARLEAAVKRISPQLNTAIFQPMKTCMAPLVLGSIQAQMKGGTPVDLQVWKRAEKADKETAGIENVADIVHMFDDLTDEEELQFMAESLRVMEEDGDRSKELLDEMVKLYAAGEAEKIDALLEREIKKMAEGDFKELGKRIVKKLIDDRDATMSKTMLNQFTQRPDKVHFFAVGTGHCIGEKSIISHLEKAGYKVTRVGP